MYQVDYQLYRVLFVPYNRVRSHVGHESVINTSNVECPGKMCCIRESCTDNEHEYELSS